MFDFRTQGYLEVVSIVPAQDAGEVLAFLRDLGRRAKPFAERDYAELIQKGRSIKTARDTRTGTVGDLEAHQGFHSS